MPHIYILFKETVYKAVSDGELARWGKGFFLFFQEEEEEEEVQTEKTTWPPEETAPPMKEVSINK